ncbi:MAG: alcohol dehydrogenase catalytic domain-containing protein [Cyanobacteria bacterium]|nr:alcohol dehydrogenase catalytic domain-containing protein [Cyanobacteriota bacterium]
MKTANLRRWEVTGKRELRLVGLSLPRLRATDVQLEFMANGVCFSDTHMFLTGAVHPGHKGPHKPLALGHELVARVIRVGRKVAGLARGDVVAVEPGLPCGECPNCKKERYHCCAKTLYMGTPPQDGGLADEFVWPAKWCHKLPESLAQEPVLASLIEPLAACRQAWQLRNRIVSPQSDEWTVIVGSGAMALGVLAIIKASNPNEKVLVMARSNVDLEFARRFGADATLQLSTVDPHRIADQVAGELFDLFRTDHFDHDESVGQALMSTRGGEAAARAAQQRARECRDHGAHELEIRSEMWKAAVTAAAKILVEENKAVFARAQNTAGGFVSSLFECTGNERLLETAIESRFMLADGCIIGLGCHYGISFDAAYLRRLELAFQPVRRSCNQFPATIKLIEENPALFRQLIGGTAKFEDFGPLMKGELKPTPTGTGGPKTVIVK